MTVRYRYGFETLVFSGLATIPKGIPVPTEGIDKSVTIPWNKLKLAEQIKFKERLVAYSECNLLAPSPIGY